MYNEYLKTAHRYLTWVINKVLMTPPFIFTPDFYDLYSVLVGKSLSCRSNLRSESGVLLWRFYNSILDVLRHPVAKSVYGINVYDRRSGDKYKLSVGLFYIKFDSFCDFFFFYTFSYLLTVIQE